MKYLILSDIHGCLPTLEQALRFYEEQHCDMLCILGDILNYGPRNRIPEGIDPKGIVERLNSMKDSIVAVRGNCDAEVDQMLLQFPVMADYALLVDEGVRLFLTHGIYIMRKTSPSAVTISSFMDTPICGNSNRRHTASSATSVPSLSPKAATNPLSPSMSTAPSPSTVSTALC